MAFDLAGMAMNILPRALSLLSKIGVVIMVVIIGFIIVKYGNLFVRYRTLVILYSKRMSATEDLTALREEIEKEPPEKRIKLLKKLKFNGKIFIDKGAWIKKRDGTEYFRLKKLKQNIEPPDYEMHQVANDEFIPVSKTTILMNGEHILKTGDKDTEFWRAEQLMANRLNWNKVPLWKEIMPYAIFTLCVVGCLLLTYVTTKNMAETSRNMSNVGGIMDRFIDVFQKAGGQSGSV
jgi:hypothetical protein